MPQPTSTPAAQAGHGERVLVAGATGYIGRHVTRELVHRGYQVVAVARPRAGIGGRLGPDDIRALFPHAAVRFADVTDAASLERDGFRGESFDAVVSCLATRTGGIEDAWRVEHAANQNLLAGAQAAGADRFVLLSAICVQKPRLAFQHAKLAFEAELETSPLRHAIVRPTAYFKSLAGQIPRLRAGKPFILFGSGDGPACQPIGETDVARFLAECLEDRSKQDAVLPIGGPRPALSARERGELLFQLLGRRPQFRRIPVALFDGMIPVLRAGATVIPRWADKAEFARIGRYYATESMLALDPETGHYDAEATPAVGEETLEAFYRRMIEEGLAGQERGDHALF